MLVSTATGILVCRAGGVFSDRLDSVGDTQSLKRGKFIPLSWLSEARVEPLIVVLVVAGLSRTSQTQSVVLRWRSFISSMGG